MTTSTIHIWPRSYARNLPVKLERLTLCGQYLSIKDDNVVFFPESFFGSQMIKCQDCLNHPEMQMHLLARTEL